MRTPTTYIARFLLLGLLWPLLRPGPVRAQPEDPCAALTHAASIAYQTQHAAPEVLTFVASAAQRARRCYGAVPTPQSIRLLKMEVWSLDSLKRYQEASALVDHFFASFYEAASDEDRAGFARRRLRFKRLQGDFAGAAVAYEQVLQYAQALPRERRVDVRLDGAALYHQAGYYELAVRRAEEALAMAASGGAPGLAYARALFARSAAQREIERGRKEADPHTMSKVVDDLETAAAQFHRLGALGRYRLTLAVLGQTYAETGKEALASLRLDEALRAAAADADSTRQIFALLSRGRACSLRGAFRQAEVDWQRALSLAEASGIATYTAELLLELGTLYEKQGQLREAEARYRRVLDQPRVAFSEDTFRLMAAQRQARDRLLRVMPSGRHPIEHRWFILAMVTLALLMIAAGYILWRGRVPRPERASLQRQLGFTVPLQPLPARRLMYLSMVLDAPHQVAALIREQDPHLARRLEKGLLRSRSDLYLCIATIERAVEGRALTNPVDTIRMDLYRYCKKMSWPWPRSIDAWRLHFKYHPLGR